MVQIKSKSDYVITDNFKPGPKNGHLSVKDPEFVEVEATTVEALAPLWAAEVPLDKFKESWLLAPPALPEGCPEPGKDVFISKMKVPVRDGTQIEIQIYRPPEPRTDAALVFRMHGGGWTVGSHEIEEAENRYLGALPNAVVVSVDYRMAPEFPYPYPIEDSWDVLKWCKAHAKYLGVNPEKIILVGNSGGGNMAACLAIKARDEGLTGIVAQSLVFPVTCHPKFFSEVPNKEKYELLSWSQNREAAILDSYRMEFFWDLYVGTDPKPDPGHSPLLHQLKDLKGLPPACVHVGGVDPLRDEGIAYAEALKAAGNDVQLATYPGLPHCFYMFVEFKQTKDYFERVIGFVKKHAESGSAQAKRKPDMATDTSPMDVLRVYAETYGSALRDYLDSIKDDKASIALHVSVLFVTSIFLVFLRRRYFSPVSHVPGPFLASVSRLWHLKQIYGGKQNLRLLEQHEKYGPFVRMAPNEISITHPDGVKKLLLATLPKGDWYRIVCFPDYRFTTPFSMVDPKEKNECSKYLTTGYLQHNIVKSEPALDVDIAKLFGWMDKFADEKKQMDLDKFFTYVAFDITGEVVFSKPFGFMDKGEDVRGSIAMNSAMEVYIAFAGYFQWLHSLFANPFTTWLAILPMGHLFDTTMTALSERQKNPDASHDLAAHWFKGLEKSKQDKSKYFNLRCLQAFATANVGAGSDTVSAGLQSFVYHLLRHPDGWQKIVAEIDAARKQGRCEGPVISNADAVQLPYLQAALKESLRMFAPVSMGLPRVAPKGGIQIGDQHFPEGVTLTVSPAVTHLSKSLWGPDAQEFRPERWFEPDAAAKERYFIPWGVGYASCPGQHIAKIQLSKIAATIVRDYEIRQVDPSQEWSYSAYFTAVPHDWPVFVSKR